MMLQNRIGIFAARKAQRRYADKLGTELQKSGFQCQTLWYKDVSLFRGLGAINSSYPEEEAILDATRNTLKNSPAGLKSGSSYPLKMSLKRLEGRILFQCYRACLQQQNIQQLVLWNGLKFRQWIMASAARSLGIPCYFIERGPFPGTTTLDPNGINFLNSVPREPEFYQQLAATSALQSQARPLSETAESRPEQLPEHYIFVPLQVNTDTQTVLFSPWVRNMFELLEATSKAADQCTPKPNLVFKAHPSCPQCYKDAFSSLCQRPNVHVVTDIPASTLIQHADAVVTINSSIGMESLLMRKKLLVLGQAFYGLPGLVLHCPDQQSLNQAMQNVGQWQFDHDLLEAFLSHVDAEHAVTGVWQQSQPEHLTAMAERLARLMENAA